jgi:hypothetical protein
MTQEELEKIKKNLVNLEVELEGYIEEYKADGRITKEERSKLKNAKKSIRYVRKELSKATKVFQKEQKFFKKASKKEPQNLSDEDSQKATFLGTNLVGTGTFVILENNLDKLLTRGLGITDKIIREQLYFFMPADSLEVNKNLLLFQEMLEELKEIQGLIPAALSAMKDTLNEILTNLKGDEYEERKKDNAKKIKKREVKREEIKNEFTEHIDRLSRHLKSQEEIEKSFSKNEQGELVLDLRVPSLPSNVRLTPAAYEVFDLPLFEGGKEDFCSIDNNDVVQLQNGNCTLIAALMQIASKEPQLIKNAIQPKGKTTKKEKTITNYAVTLYLPQKEKEGKKVNVLVSNEFYTSGDGIPFFAGKGDNEIWVLLIEKAVASLLGGYSIFEIDGYSLNLILSVLTGQPSPRGNLLGDKGMDVEELTKWFVTNKNKVITVASITHAYSVSHIEEGKELKITLVDPMTLIEKEYTVESIKNGFAEVAVVPLTAEGDCPDDLQNEVDQTTKPIKATNSFLKLKQDDQLAFLAEKTIQWKDYKGDVGTITKIDDRFIYLETSKRLKEIPIAELNTWGLQVIIPANHLIAFFEKAHYINWIDKDNNEYSFISFYNDKIELESTEKTIELSIDEFYETFGVLKK